MPISRLNKYRKIRTGHPTPAIGGQESPATIHTKIRVAVSCGDAAGISYEIIFKALRRFIKLEPSVYFLIIGDWNVAAFTLKRLKLNLKLLVINNEDEIDFRKEKVNFINLNLIRKFSLKDAGRVNALFGRASLESIEKACKLIREKKADCLVTAPVNKKAVCLSKRNFKGHTELLAKLSKTKRVAMMIAGERLKVVLLTRHVPLKRVSALLNKRDILSAAMLTSIYLRRFFGTKHPKIGLCALNPHAGEDGLFGREEKNIIAPAAREARKRKINLVGPLPADSVFEKAWRGEFDAVLCLYHDQGLIPLKMLERDRAVNITLGLPFVRTSPAHGTAYDIAYRNKAGSASFYFAIKKAVEMVRNVKKFN